MKRQLITLIMLGLMVPSTAHAYIDPGSGSALMSIVIGAFVAAGLAIKTFWYRLTGLFSKKTKADLNADQ